MKSRHIPSQLQVCQMVIFYHGNRYGLVLQKPPYQKLMHYEWMRLWAMDSILHLQRAKLTRGVTTALWKQWKRWISCWELISIWWFWHCVASGSRTFWCHGADRSSSLILTSMMIRRQFFSLIDTQFILVKVFTPMYGTSTHISS